MQGKPPDERGPRSAYAKPSDDATEALPSAQPRSTDEVVATELGAGERLGAWRLLRELGHGGMGAVHLAERADGHFEQLAAIKLIRGVPDAATLLQFARERQILAALQHPHIARLLDGGATPGGQPYLVMEYVAGEPIDLYCEKHSLDLVTRLRLFQDVCRAVQFAHQRLVVHCDLKPSNVLVRADGTPALLDFGIARALDRQRLQEFVGSSYMTPGYASPEQLRGETLTTSSDVFALGLVLFELITGRRARLADDDRTVTQLRTGLVKPSELAPTVPWAGRLPGDLDAIVLRATADDPQARYASAEDFARDIQRYLDHWPVQARARSTAYVAALLLRRRWPTFAVAAGILVVVGLFTWRLAAERDHARAAETTARMHAATADTVSDFLVSVFDISNPQLNQNREVSARAVLDEGSARIGKQLVEQPQTKARLLATLATAYRHIGDPKRAADLFEQAIALYLDPRVGDPLAAAAASSQLAVVESNDIPGSDAVAEAKRSLALRERYAPNDPLEMGDAYNTLGITLEATDAFDAAEAALRKSLDLRRSAEAPPSMIASSLHNLALVVAHRGKPKDALPYLTEALDLRLRDGGDHAPGYQQTLKVYGVNLMRAGEFEQGVAILRRNLALCIELYGSDSTHTAAAHNELGSAVHDLGRFREAATHYEEALRIETATSGAENALLPLNNLASAYEDMGDYSCALPLFERSLAFRLQKLPIDDDRVLRAQQNLARILLDTGDARRAKPLLDRALAGFRQKLGADSTATMKAEMVLGSWCVATKHDDELAGVVARLRDATAEFTPLMRARRYALEAELAASSGDAAAVLAARKSAWRALQDPFGDSHPQTAQFAMDYVEALDADGQHAEAQRLVALYRAVIDDAFVDGAPVRVALARRH